MKKTLGALMALSAGGAAFAQSAVQLYGVVNAAVSSYRADGGAGKLAVGYICSPSKRAALYAYYARISDHKVFALSVNADAEAGPTPLPGGTLSRLDLGVRHSV